MATLSRNISIRRAARAILAMCFAAITCSAHAVPPTVTAHYASHWRQTLDLYLPNDGAGPFPVVVYIHGGGWLAGDKALAQPYVDGVLARGWALASINYRYSWQATFPAQLHDCKGAIRWLRAHAGEYQLDVARFAVFGESAGGHLASLVATTGDDASLEGNVGGNLQQGSDVLAAIHGYGPTDLLQLAEYSDQRGNEVSALIGYDIYEIIQHQFEPGYGPWVSLVNSANPAMHINAGDPPMLLVHGLADDVVPHEQSELLAAALEDAGVSGTLHLLDGVGHWIPDSELEGLYEFLAQHLSPPAEIITCIGEDDGDGFGTGVAIIGDVNGDGVDDFVVGAPFNDDRGPDAGRISVNSGLDGTTLRVIRGAAAGDRFGWAVDGAGDLNGDGIPDFVVGSPRSDVAGPNSGRVDVFSGGTWKRLRTFHGERAGDQLGYAVAAANVLGDARAEIFAGAPFSSQPLTRCGRVLGWSMSDGSLLRRFRGVGANDRFGWALANAGDVDGDSLDEIVIGAPHSATGGAHAGSVYAWGYDGTRWLRRFMAHGSTGDQMGSSVAGIGDADGDGLAEIAAGAPHAKATGIRSGRVRVYSPANAALLVTLQPQQPQQGEQFGCAIAGVNDVDGDGLADIVVGACRRIVDGVLGGRVSVHSAAGHLLSTHDGSTAGAMFGESLARGGLSGVGAGMFIAAAPADGWSAMRPGIVYILTSPQP